MSVMLDDLGFSYALFDKGALDVNRFPLDGWGLLVQPWLKECPRLGS